VADEDILRALHTKLMDNGHCVRRHDAYYDGQKRLQALGLSLPPEMRQLQTVINWPRLTVDSLEERIDVWGFRMFGADEPDDRLWAWWQANNLDEESGLGHLEAFVQGRAYVTVGFDEDNPDTPLITVESARNMVADVDPRTRQVKSAARFYDYTPEGMAGAAALYLPEKTVYYRSNGGKWVVSESIPHAYGRVPVVPIVNKARLHDRGGRSEMADVIDLTDSACRAVTNLQGAQELLAFPSRYLFGVGEDEMHKSDGTPVTKWEAYLGRFNAIGDENAKVQQLPAADLRNLTQTIDFYARMVASLTGMPSHYMGLSNGDANPASADAVRTSEARHVKRAERKQRVFGGAWEEVMRLGMLVVDGNVPDDAKRMECVFADASTPTKAQTADAVVKLVQAGVMPREMAWEELGFSAEKRRRLAEMADNDQMSQLVRSLGVTGPQQPPTQPTNSQLPPPGES
jgi:hypothetical protein